ncbi:MAG TPA: helix-turn-helix domain-containing protein [Candidatus Saccharimonadales bacterium]|nr:helix-turn-helix domain-containing protein [Candidatus Saccharimonadales bacterium]
MSVSPAEVYDAIDLPGLDRRPMGFQLSNLGQPLMSLECDVDVTDRGRIGIPANSLSRLDGLAEDQTVIWLSSEFEVEKIYSDHAHRLNAVAVLGDLAVHSFDIPVLRTPSGEKVILVEELRNETVFQLARTKSVFELWLLTRYTEDILQVQDLFVDELGNISVSGGVTEERFTSKERQFLKFLSDRRNQACTTEELYAAIWGETGVIHDTSSLRVMVGKVRTKLKVYGKEELLKTLFGIGYMLEVPDEQE